MPGIIAGHFFLVQYVLKLIRSLYINHLIYILPVLLYWLVIGITNLYIGYIAHFNFFTTSGHISNYGSGYRWYYFIAVRFLFIISTTVIIVINCCATRTTDCHSLIPLR